MKKRSLLNNLIWKFSERLMTQLVTLIVSIILARLLSPEDYGTIAVIYVFITLAEVLVIDGFGNALVQKKDADALDFSTALVFNLFLGTALYALFYFSAPFIADFYGGGYHLLVPILRVLGLRLLFSAVSSIQQAQLAKSLEFDKSFLAAIIGAVCSGITGVAMAYAGYGVWALVAQYLTNAVVHAIALRVIIGTFPKLRFSLTRFRSMIHYGFRMLGTSFLTTAFVAFRSMFIGKIYTAEHLAYYDKGRQFPNLLISNMVTAITSVLFPQMSLEQDDKSRIKDITRRTIRFTSYFVFPVLLGFAAVVEPFVEVVLTQKWLPSVPLMQLFCFVYLFMPIHIANMQAVKALGHGGVYMKLESFKNALELIMLLVLARVNVKAFVLGVAITSALFTFVSAYPNKKLLNYTFREQLKDFLPNLLNAVVMAAVVSGVGLVSLNALPMLALQVLTGVGIYVLLSAVTKNPEFQFLLDKLLHWAKRS